MTLALPRRRADRVLAATTLFGSVFLAWMVFVTENPMAAFGITIGLLFAGLILVKPAVGIYTILAGVLVVEQYPFNPRVEAITAEVPLYDYVFGQGLQLTPLDLLFACSVLGMLILWLRTPKGAGIRTPRSHNGLRAAAVMLALVMVLAELHGMLRSSCQYYTPVGGWANCNFDFAVTTFEIKPFVYLLASMLLAFRLLDTPEKLRWVLRIFMVAVSIKALQACYRLAKGIRQNWSPNELRAPTAHEDALFMALFLLAAMAIIGMRRRGLLERQMLVLSPLVLLGFIAANRRIGYVGLGVATLMMIPFLPKKLRRRLGVFAIPALIVAMIYVPAFWNIQGPLGRPAHVVKAIFVPTGTDLSSNEYREWEQYDVLTTISHNLAFGIGFGHRYEQPIPLPALDSEHQPYIPHNEIWWVWLKTGTVGFVAFWTAIGAMFVSAGIGLRRHYRSTFLLIGLLGLTVVPLQILASYADLQLTFFRNMTVLGVLAGAAARTRLFEPTPEEEPAPARPTQAALLRERALLHV
ncbi:MAG TPA: O-antigen ligase family protein [Actinomycetota bacterium]